MRPMCTLSGAFLCNGRLLCVQAILVKSWQRRDPLMLSKKHYSSTHIHATFLQTT